MAGKAMFCHRRLGIMNTIFVPKRLLEDAHNAILILMGYVTGGSPPEWDAVIAASLEGLGRALRVGAEGGPIGPKPPPPPAPPPKRYPPIQVRIVPEIINVKLNLAIRQNFNSDGRRAVRFCSYSQICSSQETRSVPNTLF